MVKIIHASAHIEQDVDGLAILKHIERAGRTCYKSEGNITEDGESAKKFVAMILKRGHESVLEHYSISVRVICDRGVTHEIVRHRINAFSQESTRYCNYGADKFGNEITVIEPRPFLPDREYSVWLDAMHLAEKYYMMLIERGVSPQIARSVLPNSLKTEIVWTANLRQWRHIFKLRTSKAAHPQMREIMIPLLQEFKDKIPVMFDDIAVE